MMPKAFFVAATGQNIGKTTICLGLLAGLKKRFAAVSFFKPVGQESVETETGTRVDKDVLLFKSHFHLPHADEEMSPVLLPRGLTRDYLDGKVHLSDLSAKISRSFHAIGKHSPITIVEGTGHTGVGSIVDLNNAQVAALLKIPVILIASGGLGSSFDELSLNHAQCEKYGVRVAGVILNRVLEGKREMILHYMTLALARWKVPLLGAIPYDAFLSTPTMLDFELLFQTHLLTGAEHRLRHFQNIRLVASSTEIQRTPNQLIITPADREDIVLSTLTHFWDAKIAHPDHDIEAGIILTGKHPPKDSLIDQIRRANIPMIHAPVSSFIAMKMINTHTTKIRQTDTAKINEAIHVVEEHIDFDILLKALES